MLRGELRLRHEVEFLPQLFRGFGDVAKPLHQVGRRVKPAKVQITGAIAEPAAHLHQRVIHLRGAHEVAHAEPFEGQAPCELVASDGDDLECGARRSVVKGVLGHAIDSAHFDVVENGGQLGEHLAPFWQFNLGLFV